MTQTDYESLREELQGSGTPPSNELIEALIGEGFDIPSPQSPTGNLASSLTQSLLESLQLFELGELTEEQLSTRIESHASRGAITKGQIVDEHR